MTDIGKIISMGGVDDPDKLDRVSELAGWTREQAAEAARAEGLELGDKHWEVIDFLRAHYLHSGPSEHARELAAALDQRFAADGGRKHLYELFPGGPVTQGGRIAGVPVPADSRNPSFGSVF